VSIKGKKKEEPLAFPNHKTKKQNKNKRVCEEEKRERERQRKRERDDDGFLPIFFVGGRCRKRQKKVEIIMLCNNERAHE